MRRLRTAGRLVRISIFGAVTSVLVVGAVAAHAGYGVWSESFGWPAADSVYYPSVFVASSASADQPIEIVANSLRGTFTSGDDGVDWLAQGAGPKQVRVVAVAPSAPQTMYEDTGDGVANPAGFYRSTDAGLTWQLRAEPPLVNCTTSRIVISPSNAGELFALNPCGFVAVSTDGAASWNMLPLPQREMNEDLAVTGLVVDPTSGALYASTGIGIFRSANGTGSDWARQPGGSDCRVRSLAGLESGSQLVLYAGVEAVGDLCAGVPSGGALLKSSDGAASAPIVGQAMPNGVTVIALSPDGSRVVAADGSGNIETSGDAGASFQRSATALGVLDSLAVDPADPNTVIAGSAGSGMSPDGIETSRDGGVTWKFENSLASIASTSVAVRANTGAVYASAFEIGLERSVDGATSWTSSALPAPVGFVRNILTVTPDPTSPRRVYAGTYSGVSVSNDDGATFTDSDLSTGAVDTIAADPTVSGRAYAGAYTGASGGGLWRTIDGGAHWTSATSGLADTHINVIVVDPASPQTLYAATTNDGVWKSTDGAQSWHATGLSTGWINALAIDPASPTTLYAGTCGDPATGVYKTTDGGASWHDASTGLPAHCLNAITVDPTAPDLLYAASGDIGVWTSDDGAGDWSELNDGLTDETVYGLAIAPNGSTIYGSGQAGEFNHMFVSDAWTSITGSPQAVPPGVPVTYTTTFANDGPDDAVGVVGEVALPPGVNPPALSQNGVSCTGGQDDVCTIGALAAGEGVVVTISGPAPSTPGVYPVSTHVREKRYDRLATDDSDSTAITVQAQAVQSQSAKDTSAPTGVRLAGRKGKRDPLADPFLADKSMQLSWGAQDTGSGIATYDLRVRTSHGGRPLGNYRAWKVATVATSGTYTASFGETVCFSLRATDHAGNTSGWSTDRCTTIPMPASQLHLSGTWSRTRAHHGGSPFGATLSTTSPGSTISIPSISTRQVAVVADRCPTCGELVVTLAGRRIGTINLARRSSVHDVLIELAPLPEARTGRLVLRVISSAREVRIEAAGVRG